MNAFDKNALPANFLPLLSSKSIEHLDQSYISREILDKNFTSFEYEKAHTFPISVPNWSLSTNRNFNESLSTAVESKDEFDLYIHIPFCVTKCDFCFYYKETKVNASVVSLFVNQICEEISKLIEKYGTIKARSLYIGGGTPSFLKSAQLERIFNVIQNSFNFSYGSNICMEMSPETVTLDRLKVLERYGVNRVSLGVQSTNESVLRAWNRPHNSTQYLKAANLLKESSISSVNFDIIYGWPDQSFQDWARNLESVVKQDPTALSVYHLRAVPGTLSNAHTNRVSNWDLLVMRQMATEYLKDIGFNQTRPHYYQKGISRYKHAPCLDRRRSGCQLGLGPSAYSHLGDTVYLNASKLHSYIDNKRVTKEYVLSEEDYACRFFLHNLVDQGSVSIDVLNSLFSESIRDIYRLKISELCDMELVNTEGQVIRLTELGRLLNELVSRLLYPDHMGKRFKRISKEQLPYSYGLISTSTN